MHRPDGAPLSQAQFAAQAGVSRETSDRLAAYLDLLHRWQARINLVSRASLEDPWRRHFLDSAQLYPHIGNPGGRLYDIGSGAGFPGLVLAVMGLTDVHLLEPAQKKAAFLREAARITHTKVQIHAVRAENLSAGDADFVTARACAPLPELIDLARLLLKPTGICLFLKGREVEAELTAASKTWTMKIERIQSQSDPSGTILRLKELYRAGSV